MLNIKGIAWQGNILAFLSDQNSLWVKRNVHEGEGLNKAIVGQAAKRLAAARKKAAALRHSRSAEEIEEIWSEFLTEHTRFFNRLGNAMETVQERSHWELVMHNRKTDPVMQYLKQARNADEHGRTSVTARGSWFSVSGDVYIENLAIDNGSVIQANIQSVSQFSPARIKFNPEEIFPTEVENSGRKYIPPEYFPISWYADRAIDYIENVFAEVRRRL